LGQRWNSQDSTELANQLASLAFLPQMRVQVYDNDGAVIADTGSPQAYMFQVAAESAESVPMTIHMDAMPTSPLMADEAAWSFTHDYFDFDTSTVDISTS